MVSDDLIGTLDVDRTARRRSGGRGRRPDGRPGRDRWLLSYADFITLLLALFVVLYASAASLEAQDAQLFEGLQAAFVFDATSPAAITTPGDADPDAARPESVAPVPQLATLEQALADAIDRVPRAPDTDPGVSLSQSERGLVVSLASAEFFPAGGVTIPPARESALAAMAPFLNARTNSILFEGHTDASPVQGGPYPSNWELSSARASAVARYFIDQHALDPRRVATSGFAEFRPIEANDARDGRARNRRVEIVILADGDLIDAGAGDAARAELDALLETLPPIPSAADDSLRAPAPAPPPEDIPLP